MSAYCLLDWKPFFSSIANTYGEAVREMAEAGQLTRNRMSKANNRGSQIYIKAMSASCLLDRKIESRSFQNTAKTYGEVVRENVQTDGGQVIRNQETDCYVENKNYNVFLYMYDVNYIFSFC